VRKLTPPELYSVVLRKRLFALLDKARSCPVIWVAGPPGSGKTTLVASYLQARGLSPVWYQLDESDQDPATCFRLLGFAAARRMGHQPLRLPRWTSQHLGQVRLFTKRHLAALFAQLGTPSVLVFDDYQVALGASSLHNTLCQGFSEVPAGSHIFLISRCLPPAHPAPAGKRWFSLLDWEDLRLRPDEAAAIAQLHGEGLDPDSILKPIAKTMEGWIAGLLLGIASVRLEGMPADGIEAIVPEAVYDYFVREVLVTLDRDSQRFLVQSALLPKVTVSAMKLLTGEQRTEQLFTTLRQQSCFIQGHRHQRGAYHYHPVFRRFLLSQVPEFLDAAGQHSLQRRALRILERTGTLGDAVPLWVELGDHEGLAKLLERAAPGLLDQGRHGQLVAWIGALPEPMVARSPWLQCWRALSLLPSDPCSVRAALQTAYQRFQALDDAEGRTRAGFGIVQSYWFERNDFGPLRAWLDTLWPQWQRHRESSSQPESDYTLVGMYAALIVTDPGHTTVAVLERRLLYFIASDANRPLRRFACLLLLFRSTWLGGGHALAAKGLCHLRALATGGTADPLAEITRAYGEALYQYWFSDDLDPCLSQVVDGLATAGRADLHCWDGPLLTLGAMALLALGKQGPAESYLEKLAGLRRGQFDSAHYRFVGGWREWLTGRGAEAREQGEMALKAGWASGELGAGLYSALLLVQIDVAEGAYQLALRQLARIRYQARSAHLHSMEILGGLTAGLVALRRGQAARCDRFLATALRRWRLTGFRHLPCLRTTDLADLCARALDGGIEVDFVQGLIRGCGLRPTRDALASEHWPWPIKIYCLGKFSFCADGEPVRFSHKAPKRVLALLKALLALGGQDVPQTALMDALWSEEDADAANRAFKTALFRLRQLLGQEVITVQKGRVSLQPERCWVDVWAFEQLSNEVGRLVEAEQPVQAAESLSRAAWVYRGDFLVGEEAPWMSSVRARLRQRFVRAMHELGAYHERQGRYETAIQCYQKGLQIDGCAEQLHQGLMQSYQRLGRKSEALEAYRRCKRLLATAMNVDPSPSTEKIRRSLDL
jgi:LuxR family maltose regulon positive regulatory protein